jgi:hypothetical protein
MTTTGMTTSNESLTADARETYSNFILERLAAEETRKMSLEQRGISVVTTSGALVTATFAIAAIVTSRSSFKVPHSIVALLTGVAGAFLVSALFAISTNLPLRYRDIDVMRTIRLMHSHWSDDQQTALARITATRGVLLRSARESNTRKSILLLIAMLAEAAAILLLALAVGLLLSAA